MKHSTSPVDKIFARFIGLLCDHLERDLGTDHDTAMVLRDLVDKAVETGNTRLAIAMARTAHVVDDHDRLRLCIERFVDSATRLRVESATITVLRRILEALNRDRVTQLLAMPEADFDALVADRTCERGTG